jgi:hypothetical protein
MIEGLPNTTWDPLVAAGKITFEIPEEQSWDWKIEDTIWQKNHRNGRRDEKKWEITLNLNFGA